jgi:hypothetical protein
MRSATDSPTYHGPLVCTEVRDRLPDHVMSALREDEEREVDRHLEWCAGCRKELAELEEGVAAVGLALEPIAPPEELAEKVVERVSEAAGARARERRRFRIVTAIAVVTTFVAIAALGYAAAVSGRFERYRTETAAAQDLADQLGNLLRTFGGQQILGARLSPTEGQVGGGQAIVYLSDEDAADWVLVIAGGLPKKEGPYFASLVHGSGVEVPVGPMFRAKQGQVSVYRFFNQDLTSFKRVVVTDDLGRVVLTGLIHGPAV